MGRGWKPHLRKWRGSSSTSRAGLPEVRHLAAPWRGHGRGRHECWGGPQRWGELRFSAASRKFSSHKVARKRDPPAAPPPRGGTRFCASAGAWRARRRAHRISSLVSRHSSLAHPQGWKPHLRKWRGSSSTSRAGLPEVRHLAAPGRDHGRGRHECWGGPQRWGGLRFPAVSRKFSSHKVARKRDPPGALPPHGEGRASARPRGHGAPEGAPAASRHSSLVTRHWRARRARRPTAPAPSAPCGGRAGCRTGRACTPTSRTSGHCRRR